MNFNPNFQEQNHNIVRPSYVEQTDAFLFFVRSECMLYCSNEHSGMCIVFLQRDLFCVDDTQTVSLLNPKILHQASVFHHKYYLFHIELLIAVMVEKQFRSIPYYGVLLAFIALSAVFQNARADETVLDAKEAFLDLDVEDLAVGMHLSFAEWCSTSFCNLRLFAVVGGELLMVDSVRTK